MDVKNTLSTIFKSSKHTQHNTETDSNLLLREVERWIQTPLFCARCFEDGREGRRAVCCAALIYTTIYIGGAQGVFTGCIYPRIYGCAPEYAYFHPEGLRGLSAYLCIYSQCLLTPDPG